ncbi:Signal transduction histidine kinase [Brevibacterium sp. 239c]|uniref:sensor histidine kinase n=1 Tax=Brevibacterium sp. 239c TaxID=1965356 RepID=UPI000C4263BB|nr:hypothetical protein [Brevibacterium sp. 239c]SMX97482.1 Signal transduction histidine kinase [Brevibacterium sp. 239c]
MTSALDDGNRSGTARLWQLLRGPRFVDFPIRLLALILGLTVLIPGSFEIAEPRYMTLLICAYALIIISPFLPLATVFVSTGLSLVFVVAYPDLENMFPEALIFATAVLLSHRRWVGSAIGTAGLVIYLITCTELGAYDGGIEGFVDLGFGWLTYSLLGLAAGFVELRIQREIGRRERAAVEHQQAVDSLRARFTSDMHDTISNSLATEGAIIKALARGSQDLDANRQLAELSLVNAEASKRLRRLVAQLSDGDDRRPRVRLQAEAKALAAAIENGCAAGGVALTLNVGNLPRYASPVLGAHFTAIMRELATNVIRHALPETKSSLTVSVERDVTGERGDTEAAVLRFRTENEAAALLSHSPRSLSRRAHALGGTCTTGSDHQGRVVVEVTQPLRFNASADGDEVDAVCARDDFTSASPSTPPRETNAHRAQSTATSERT